MAALDEISIAERLELFFGTASDASARVYARLDFGELRDGLRLQGTITGPKCLYAETLPATFRFIDRGPGESLLAEAMVEEPCFWSPEMPQLYNADVGVFDGQRRLARVQRVFGIRPLAAHKRRLYFDAQGWVLRGILGQETPASTLDVWHVSDVVMVVEDPGDDVCEQASRVGVLLAADVPRPTPDLIRRLARWPAVGIVILPTAAAVDISQLAHNLVLAQRCVAGQAWRPQPWAHLAWCEVTQSRELPEIELPVVAVRPAGHLTDVASGRMLCDRLQRDLAPNRQLAGYVV